MRILTAIAIWVLLLGLGHAAGADATELDEAKAAYRAVEAEARATMLKAFDEAVQQTAAKGELDPVKALLAEKQAFEEDHKLPHSEAMRSALAAYRQQLAAARRNLLDAFDAAIKAQTKALNIELATALKAERDAFEKRSELTGGDVFLPVQLDESDPVLRRLVMARKNFDERQEAAGQTYLQIIDRRVELAEKRGDAEAVAELKAVRNGFVQSGIVGSSDDRIVQAAGQRYERAIAYAGRPLTTVYEHAIARLEATDQPELASRLAEEAEQWANRYGSGSGAKIDLLSKVDLDQDANPKQKWTLADDTLRCVEGHWVPKVTFPYQPPEEYNISFTFTQPQPRNGLGLVLPNPETNGQFLFVIGREGGNAVGFALNPRHGSVQQTPGLIKPGQTYTVELRVRSDALRAYLNGKPVASWKDFNNLPVGSHHDTRTTDRVHLFCDDPTVFKNITLKPVSGSGKWLR
jgi:hypothetical protein